MAQKLAFASGGSSSWADDDDLEPAPLPFAASLPKVEEQEAPRAASPRREQTDGRDRKYSSDSHDRERGHGHRDHGGYAHRSDRGGHADRGGRGDRGGYADRGDRGGYADRGGRGDRGGYADRGDRGGGYERHEREERPKNPVPDQGPYRVFMGNLSFRVNEDDIAEFFGNADAVTDVRIQREPDSDRSRGFAYVEFRDRDALVEALKLDGENFDGRAIRVDVATDNRKKTSGSFFERRGERSHRGDEPRESRTETPRQRQRLTLQPRTAPVQPKDAEAQRKNIFGEAKPRDEAAFLERKKSLEAEAKAKAAAAKAKTADQPKKSAPREPREPRESREPRERKTSHDGPDARPTSGRGGRGRGERTERAGGRGRGGQAAPAPQSERPATKKDEPKPKTVEPKKEEAKPKTVEPKMPKITKLPAPVATKTKNAFELLNDSDSD